MKSFIFTDESNTDKSQVKKDFALYITNKIGKKDLIFDTDKKGYKN